MYEGVDMRKVLVIFLSRNSELKHAWIQWRLNRQNKGAPWRGRNTGLASSRLQVWVAVVLMGILVIGGTPFLFGCGGGPKEAGPTTKDLSSDPLDVNKGWSKGAEQAKVVIIEFSDFQCPFCALVQPTLDRVMEHYGDQVKLIYRHFPLAKTHPYALKAAVAAEAAGNQGKFWEMHDKLYQNQEKLSDNDLRRYAQELGLDMERFEKDLDSSQLEEKVLQDKEDGLKAGVSGTPAFFINGTYISGNQPFGKFKELIEAELAMD
jgi:protein-disulfide isomerase